jgi:K(+)-stimulated pyrophosphate-energized sodium pump
VEIGLILGIGVAAILFAIFLGNNVLRRDTGMPEMQNISNAVKEGAEAFLTRQNKTIGTPAIAAGALTFVIYS